MRLRHDKKARDGRVPFVLMRSVGRAEVCHDVPMDGGSPGIAGDPGMTRFRMRATESELMRRMPWGLVLCVLILGSGRGKLRRAQPRLEHAAQRCLGVHPGPRREPERRARGAAGQRRRGRRLRAGPGEGVGHRGALVDGALVQFTTTMCCFAGEDEVNIVGIAVPTNRGTANVTFCGKQGRGVSTITGAVEDAFDSVLITVF